LKQEPRIGILVVAYNAATTLARVLDRIPRDFAPKIAEILVSDDSSQDSTYLVGMGYRQVRGDLPLTVIRQDANLGYGGNQKVGYQWAIEKDLDIVVLLHGDGQYAPELLPEMVAPLEQGECDAVFGSRMMAKGAARKGGMPMYKYIGNRVLTEVENKLAGAELTEWHSGYRAYNVAALKEVQFLRNSDDFDFDTQIILQFLEAGKRIKEIPCPTYYGDEVCYVNGMSYAKNVTRHAIRYRLHQAGFGSGDSLTQTNDFYEHKQGDDTSHNRIVAWMRNRKPGRVLDVGCGDGTLAAYLRACGHEVVGIDAKASERAEENLDAFVQADLDHGIPMEVGGEFDIVLAADILEHLREPGDLLEEMRGVLAPGGTMLVSVPNIGHWYPRVRIAIGKFDYDRRGTLDRTHLRFFTRASFERLVENHGLRVKRRHYVGLPLEVLDRGGKTDDASSATGRAIKAFDRLALEVRPTLFAYQFVYELEALAQPMPEVIIDKPRSESSVASKSSAPRS
jgi:2-polyprenyl-3-methyl-5-hydroxy-6-metoxy-1,4-benzoquinol methylase